MTMAQAGVIGFLVMYLLPFILLMTRPEIFGKHHVGPISRLNVIWGISGAIVSMIAQAIWNI